MVPSVCPKGCDVV